VTSDGDGRVLRVDPRTDRIVARIKVRAAPIWPVVAAGAVWFVNESEGSGLWRVDPASGRAAETDWHGQVVGRLATGRGRLWSGRWVNPDEGSELVRLDPRTGLPAGRPVKFQGYAEAVVGAGGLWVIDWEGDGTHPALLWVDPSAPPGSPPETGIWLT